MTDSQRTAVCVTAADLQQTLTNAQPSPSPVVLDVRWTLSGSDQAAYDAGHIPGAVFCDLDQHLAQPAGAGGRHPLPNPTDLVATLVSWGISPTTPVVVYDNCNSLAASRAWWCLRWVGCENVRILDGGLAAWQRVGGELDTQTPSSLQPAQPWTPQNALASVDADDLVAQQPGRCVIDVRTPERYAGEQEPIDPVAGHIPGAVNLPIGELLNADGTFKSGEDIAVLIKGVADGATTLAGYCGSGVTASQLVAAATIAGTEIQLYPGSWSGWITNPDRPIATA